MIQYGSGPDNDEVEVVVFGPGYGEAIAVHLGDQNWLLVDSCIDPDSKEPASHTYLKSIGVDPSSVKVIVATHWHDDHVRGISALAKFYPEAEFMVSAVFNSDEASTFLAAYSGVAAPDLTRGAKELHEVIFSHTSVSYVQHRSSIFESVGGSIKAHVTALSPVPAAFSKALAQFAQYLPQKFAQINHAPSLKPNLEAVVLHIDFGSDAVLLGADLEADASCGWNAVVTNGWSKSRRKGSVYKVAHHGSHSAHDPCIWTTLLQEAPMACITPFNKGKLLPSEEDKARIKDLSDQAFLSSHGTKKPEMDAAVLKRINDICSNVTRVNTGFGAVRLRKRLSAGAWEVSLFGNACKL